MNKKINFFKVYKLKDTFKLFLFLLSTIILFSFTNKNNIVIKNSLNVFLYNIFVSLFPFILFTNIILSTNMLNIVSKFFGKFFSKIFNLPKEASIAIITGFLFGFPMGAKAAESLYLKNIITKRDFKVLISFINNCNPAFILSTIGIIILNNIRIGIILLISHLLSSIIIGFIYSKISPYNIIQKNTANFKDNNIINKINKKSDNNFFVILSDSIINTFKTLLNIFGYLLVFNILFEFFKTLLQYFKVPQNITKLLSGIFEMTNGCINISNLNIPFIIKLSCISFTLGFSGFCVLFQIYHVIQKYNINFSFILKFKLLQGILSSFITYVVLKYLSINSSLSVFANKNTNTIYKLTKFNNMDILNKLNISYIISVFLIIILLFFNYKYKSNKSIATKKKGKKSCYNIKEGV